ncbi:MAG: cbb3-type cytochrome oxidase assembly protein CcoS [Phycisphaerae bacterium]|nr:cbb3-type cytochrome oxidase assembly protein CcoS [Phycisphaerae bacterium]MCZ2401165.1 cbb3-type cytochrome oxidase assembly protein CcoS [Phycisphaerae bacterium]
MSVIYVILPLAMLMGAAAVAAFIWAVRSGQYDDVDTTALRLLHDDDVEPPHRPRSHSPRRQRGRHEP